MASSTDIAQKILDLEEALGSGVLSVSHDGKLVTYRSVDDLQKAINFFKSCLSAANNRQVSFARHRRG